MRYYLLITNSQGSRSRQSSLEHIQRTQIRLVTSHTYSLKARPPKGVFKCFASLPVTPVWACRYFLQAFPQVSLSYLPPPWNRQKQQKKPNNKILIKGLRALLLAYLFCTLRSWGRDTGSLATSNRGISEKVPEYILLQTQQKWGVSYWAQ